MDKSSREVKAQWQRQQRTSARAAFPLPDEQLEQMFGWINLQLDAEDCDHTLKVTLRWLADQDMPAEATIDWLRDHGGYCDCEVIANAAEHWAQNKRLAVEVPSEWTVTYEDPSLAGDDWELKEDLLQLRHSSLNRLVDLGWYIDHFRIYVLEGDFQGEVLSEVSVQDSESARSALRGLLARFGKP